MKIKLDRGQRKLFETLLFLVKLLVFAIPLYIMLAFSEVLLPLQGAVSHNVYHILKSLGFEVVRSGFLLRADGFAFLVSEDCTGWKSMLFLAALIFAVPGVLVKKRLLGLLVVVPVIYIGNLLRILAVVFIWKAYGYEFANIIHDYFWQLGLISLVLIVWVSWLIWAGKAEVKFLKRFRKLIKPR